ncbi:hypothetical protein [Streptomyces sp. NPDC086766]|uniref:hypothetical protein n=1 Tax=Streptomyces sp. NPDC086766 TaxID=3365754 RepID=UPI0038028A37
MAVNEAVLALLRPKPHLSQLANKPADVLAAAQAAVDAPAGLGTIAFYATEVALPATGTWSNPSKGGAKADIVITAPEDGVPLLFVEIDNCFESAQVLAAKIDKYMRICQRKLKDVDGKERPMWRTRWWVLDGRDGDSRTRRCCSSRPERSSGASAGHRTRRTSRRSAIRAAKPTTPASRPSTPPASGSTRNSCAARPSSRRPSGKPAARCAPVAAPGSPTNGGRPSSPPGGAPRAIPTRTCATTASSAPSLPNAKPSRPGTSTRSTTRSCPSRRPAAHGSPASAGDARTRLSAAAARLNGRTVMTSSCYAAGCGADHDHLGPRSDQDFVRKRNKTAPNPDRAAGDLVEALRRRGLPGSNRGRGAGGGHLPQ